MQGFFSLPRPSRIVVPGSRSPYDIQNALQAGGRRADYLEPKVRAQMIRSRTWDLTLERKPQLTWRSSGDGSYPGLGQVSDPGSRQTSPGTRKKTKSGVGAGGRTGRTRVRPRVVIWDPRSGGSHLKENGTEFSLRPVGPPSGERSADPIEAMVALYNAHCLPHVWNEPLWSFLALSAG